MRRSVSFACAILGTACLALSGMTASAQSLSPMKKKVAAFGEQFALRLAAGNPYKTAMRMSIHVYDMEWNEIKEAKRSRPIFELAPGGRTSFFVLVPFDGEKTREIYVCAETETPLYDQSGAAIEGQVCGKYLAGQRRAS